MAEKVFSKIIIFFSTLERKYINYLIFRHLKRNATYHSFLYFSQELIQIYEYKYALYLIKFMNNTV